MANNEIQLDETDIKILRIMQADAKIANVHLAKKLKMAPSAVLERVRKLEEKGVIKGFAMEINPRKLGKNLLAFIFIKTSEALGSDKAAKMLATLPEVMEVHDIAGEDCCLVKLRVSDTDELMELKRTKFAKIPQILSMRTTIVLETIKESPNFLI